MTLGQNSNPHSTIDLSSSTRLPISSSQVFPTFSSQENQPSSQQQQQPYNPFVINQSIATTTTTTLGKRPATVMLDIGPLNSDTHTSAQVSNQQTNLSMQSNQNNLLGHMSSHHQVQDDALPTAQLYDVRIDSPGSPGAGYKRMRSSADSDAGSSSSKDMEELEVAAPDSVPALVAQLRQLLDYVASKPKLQKGSASFIRDYLRTMLMVNSVETDEVILTANKEHKADVVAGRTKPSEAFKNIPDELAKHIFSFLDGENLARAREVCRRWNDFACEEPLWKALCLKKWRSLDSDEHVWKLIDKKIDKNTPNCWRRIFPKVNRSPQWRCRLQKTGRFICNLVAHQIAGSPLGDAGLPEKLVVERRFNIQHLQTFVLPDASVLYFEPEQECDRNGFEDFIEYLNRRTRAGLALEEQRRFIFIPPCDYTHSQVEYHGQSLLGVVQNAYPPLAQ